MYCILIELSIVYYQVINRLHILRTELTTDNRLVRLAGHYNRSLAAINYLAKCLALSMRHMMRIKFPDVSILVWLSHHNTEPDVDNTSREPDRIRHG